MIFAGWEMPVWYTSVVEEHMACAAAGLSMWAHMVYQAEGPMQPGPDSVER
jgi:glycine hydroxymethyltransferase